jgi:hypothetical protein
LACAGEGKKGNKEEKRPPAAPVSGRKKTYDFTDEKLVFESREPISATVFVAAVS